MLLRTDRLKSRPYDFLAKRRFMDSALFRVPLGDELATGCVQLYQLRTPSNLWKSRQTDGDLIFRGHATSGIGVFCYQEAPTILDMAASAFPASCKDFWEIRLFSRQISAESRPMLMPMLHPLKYVILYVGFVYFSLGGFRS